MRSGETHQKYKGREEMKSLRHLLSELTQADAGKIRLCHDFGTKNRGQSYSKPMAMSRQEIAGALWTNSAQLARDNNSLREMNPGMAIS